jgi:DNA invertase Pin-like site-specific DNA recombinase
VKTDYNPEGISIPAQRDACLVKCSALQAEVANEFSEPGRSAQEVEKRIVFQEMMAWVKAHRDEVDYIVVYQFNRVFRNAIDAAITKRELSKWGVRIVQTAFDLPEGPEGDMIEMILNAVDEYRVKRDGADIAYKMGTKAKNGGTISRARLGYRNARDMSEGRNIGIVELDSERAPLIVNAFELYATGEFSLESLSAELTIRGLKTRPGRYPGGPISTSRLAELLRDPYYLGYVTYEGELIQGRHEALIGHELFAKVQAILDQRGGNGQRKRRHNHYLKGHLWCRACHEQGIESRMILAWANGRGGRYLYFFCVRKQQHLCLSRYSYGEEIEAALERFYATIHFPADIADRLRRKLDEMMNEQEKSLHLLAKQMKAEMTRLEKQEANLIDLAADGGMPLPKVRQKLAEVQRERDRIRERMAVGDDRLTAGAVLIDRALRLLDSAQKLYMTLSPEQRRFMNDAIFEKLYVQDDEIDGAVFRPPFDELLQARDEIQRTARAGAENGVKENGRRGPDLGPLAALYFDGGSNKGLMVGAEGLEPTTCSL